MKNLELKVKYRDLAFAAKAAKSIGAKNKGALFQSDTYFHVKRGRLKMRVINKKQFELISYHRRNLKNERYSDYEIIRLKNGPEMLEFLKRSLGVKAVVEKKRILYLYENVRIHLDTVKGLGRFIEYEAVCSSKKDHKEAGNKMKFLKKVFKIKSQDLIRYSYSDILK